MYRRNRFAGVVAQERPERERATPPSCFPGLPCASMQGNPLWYELSLPEPLAEMKEVSEFPRSKSLDFTFVRRVT